MLAQRSIDSQVIKYSLIRIRIWNFKLFELELDSFQMLSILKAVNEILAHNVCVIQKGIIWRVNCSIRFLLRQNLLITFCSSNMFSVVLSNESYDESEREKRVSERVIQSFLYSNQSAVNWETKNGHQCEHSFHLLRQDNEILQHKSSLECLACKSLGYRNECPVKF